MDDALLKRQIAAVTKENPEKRFQHGKKLLAEAKAARAERKKRCDHDVAEMTKDAVRYLSKRVNGDIFVPFAGLGKRKPLYCDVCKERVSNLTISAKGSICRSCTVKQQGHKSTVLVMPKYIKFRRAS